MITLFSTNNCRDMEVEKILKAFNLKYQIVTDLDELTALNIAFTPVIHENGKYYTNTNEYFKSIFTLYSLGASCPNCAVLEEKLLKAGIPFTVTNDKEEMSKLNLFYLPAFRVKTGDTEMIYNYKATYKKLVAEFGV